MNWLWEQEKKETHAHLSKRKLKRGRVPWIYTFAAKGKNEKKHSISVLSAIFRVAHREEYGGKFGWIHSVQNVLKIESRRNLFPMSMHCGTTELP